MIEIVFPSDFTTSNLPRIQEICRPILEGEDSEITLDLRGVKKFTPFSACYFAALVDALMKRPCAIKIHSPKNESARHQVEYLGVKSYFTGKPRLTSPRVATVAMKHLSVPDYDVAFRMAMLTRDSFRLSAAHFYLVSLCLKELLQNAFEHSGSSSGVYTCAYGARNRRVVRLCTLDLGIGVRQHLLLNPKNQSIQTDGDAIIAAMKEGVTGLPTRSRGLGLYYVKRLLQDIGGELVIASGEAIVSVMPPGKPQCRRLDVPVTGTIVSIKFHAKEGYVFRLDDYER